MSLPFLSEGRCPVRAPWLCLVTAPTERSSLFSVAPPSIVVYVLLDLFYFLESFIFITYASVLKKVSDPMEMEL